MSSDVETRFVAECLWPDVTRSDVGALDRRLAIHARSGVDHVGTTLVPEDDVVLVWFEARSFVAVRDLCLAASVPFDRVVAVEGGPRPVTNPRSERNLP
jgi:hypothetical protein